MVLFILTVMSCHPWYFQAEGLFGSVEVLVNCAGFAKCKYFEDTTLEEFHVLFLCWLTYDIVGSIYFLLFCDVVGSILS